MRNTRPTRLRILMINPNTSATITDILATRMREIAGPGVTILPVTGRFGAPYIASRAAAAIAGHAALDALAEHVADCDAVYLACFGGPGARGHSKKSHLCRFGRNGRSLDRGRVPPRSPLRHRDRRGRLGAHAK